MFVSLNAHMDFVQLRLWQYVGAAGAFACLMFLANIALFRERPNVPPTVAEIHMQVSGNKTLTLRRSEQTILRKTPVVASEGAEYSYTRS